MSIRPESRTSAETILGGLIYWVADGDTIGTDDNTKTASRTNPPTPEEAIALGKCLGMVKSWKWGAEYRTIAKEGVNPETQKYEKRETKILDKVKPTFTTQDITPEAFMLEHGLAELPAIGNTCRPFSNARGTLRGHLLLVEVDSYRTHGEDGELATVLLRGDLGLAESGENNGELKEITYELSVTTFPEDGFKNVGISADL